MTVGELIEHLKCFDPETKVVIEDETRELGEVWEMQNSETNNFFVVLEEA